MFRVSVYFLSYDIVVNCQNKMFRVISQSKTAEQLKKVQIMTYDSMKSTNYKTKCVTF